MTKKEIYKGRVVTLNLEDIPLPNGNIAKLEVARHRPAAAVVPFTTSGQKILLIRQYRPVIRQWCWEIPAGLVENNEDPMECAKRELEEETGWAAEHIEPLIDIHTSFGFTDEVLHLYKASGLKPSAKNQESTEVIEEKFFTPEEVRQMIRKREITDAKTLVALFYALGDYCP